MVCKLDWCLEVSSSNLLLLYKDIWSRFSCLKNLLPSSKWAPFAVFRPAHLSQEAVGTCTQKNADVTETATNSDKLNQLVLACSGGVARQLLKNVENIAQSSKKLRWTFFSTNSICFQISYWFNKMSCKISPCEHLWLIIFKIWFTKTDPSIAFLCVSPINLPKLYFAIASKHDFFSLNMWGIWRLL